MRRLELEQPYAKEQRRAVEAAMRRAAPKGLHRLMSWFLEEWRNEIPDRLHKGGVWWDHISLTEDRHGEGGSLLGTPATADDFRSYIEGSPFATDADGRYVRPIHAAMARLCGRQGHEGATVELAPAPFMARFLFRLATTADLRWTSTSMGIPVQAAEVYGEQAIYRLWRVYEPSPGAVERVA
jgi:hypothetical protein